MSKHQSTRQQRSRRRAAMAGLIFVNEFDQGYARRRCGQGFTYLGLRGQPLSAQRSRQRIESLAIPPAWEDVWICPSSQGHIQARGRDEAGRLQYIYHADWMTVSSATKFDRMARFAEVLPRVRRRVRKDLQRRGVPRERVLAAVVRLLDTAHIRIGNEDSERARGATTLTAADVNIERFHVSLDFPSKSGQRCEVEFSDKKLASVLRKCQELDGQFLFSYRADDGQVRSVSSSAVNDYLHEIAGERITAKDFRTWTGSTTALACLLDMAADLSEPKRKAACRQAVKAAAQALGNTLAVCRESYVHPGILAAAESGELPRLLEKTPQRPIRELTRDEARFTMLLPLLSFS